MLTVDPYAGCVEHNGLNCVELGLSRNSFQTRNTILKEVVTLSASRSKAAFETSIITLNAWLAELEGLHDPTLLLSNKTNRRLLDMLTWSAIRTIVTATSFHE